MSGGPFIDPNTPSGHAIEPEALLPPERSAENTSASPQNRFLTKLSHDLRTPLNGIVGMADLLLGTTLTQEQEAYVKMMRSSSASLTSLVNDLLDLDKIEKGVFDTIPVEFLLRRTLRHTVRALTQQADEKNITLTYHVLQSVPNVLVGDPARLRQILTHFLENALTRTEEGEVTLMVDLAPIEAESPESIPLQFSILDTGSKLPLASLERRLMAVECATDVLDPSELNLGVAVKLIKLMDGSFETDAADDGTESNDAAIHITLPFAVCQDQQETLRLFKHLNDLHGMPVLIVDDNATRRYILEEMLVHWHLKPVSTYGGWTALSAMKEAYEAGTPFPLVIIDNNIPGLGCFELIETIRTSPEMESTQIMLLRAQGERGDSERCQDLGIAAYLTKPISQSELLDSMLALFSRVRTSEADEASSLITRHSLYESRPVFKILVAEDNPLNQTVVKRLLEKRGHNVTVVDNGLKALEAIQEHPYDTVLMDIDMPEMDGIEATKRIRALEAENGWPPLTIIAMTAQAYESDRKACLEAGMSSYMTKPVDALTLFTQIEQTASSRLANTCGLTSVVHDCQAILNRFENDRAVFDSTIASYLEQTTSQIEDLKQGLESDQLEQWVALAQHIQMNAEEVGLTALVQPAKRLVANGLALREAEGPSFTNMQNQCDEAFHDLDAVFQQLIAHIKERAVSLES